MSLEWKELKGKQDIDNSSGDFFPHVICSSYEGMEIV
jgi:hypothetical protein